MSGEEREDELIEFIRQAKQGDKQAFSKLYESIYKEMYYYAFYVLKNREDAEDVVSDTVYDIYCSLKSLREEKLFHRWAFKILGNKCKKKLASYQKQTVELEENVKNPVSQEVDLEKSQDLKQAYCSLEEEERCIISMAVFGGYKSHEIGEMLDMPSGTVRSKLSRALGKMQKKMEVCV